MALPNPVIVPQLVIDHKPVAVKNVFDIKVLPDLNDADMRRFQEQMKKAQARAYDSIWGGTISAGGQLSGAFSIAKMKQAMRRAEGRPDGTEKPSFLRGLKGEITELRAPRAWLKEAARAAERGDRRLLAIAPWYSGLDESLEVEALDLKIIARAGRRLRVPAMLQFTSERDLNRYGAWFHHVGGEVDA